MTKPLLFVLLAGLVLAGCDAFSSDEAVPFADVEQTEYLRVEVTGTSVIRDRTSWERFWSIHVTATGPDGAPLAVPTVDFDRQTVLGVFYGGSFHAGCSPEVDVVRGVNLEGSTLEVKVDRLPDLGPCRAVVYPLDIVVVDVSPSQANDVQFVGRVP